VHSDTCALGRVISKWFAFELMEVEVRINLVQDIVKHAGQEMHKYKLVRNATEERLHKRIAELEVTLLAMFSQTAQHAGVEEARLIDPPLRETSPSRARLRVYSPSSFPNRPHEGTPPLAPPQYRRVPSPEVPVKLSQSQSKPEESTERIFLQKTSSLAKSTPRSLLSPRPAGHESVWTPTVLHELEHGRSSGSSPSHTPSHIGSAASPHTTAHLPSNSVAGGSSLPLQTIGSPRSIVISTPPNSARQGASWSLGDPATASSITQGILSSVTNSLLPEPTPTRPKGASTSGIGLLLEKRDGLVKVKDIASGGFADNCGLVRIGDVLESVNDTDVSSLALEEIHRVIANSSMRGSTIRLQLARHCDLGNMRPLRFVATVTKSKWNRSPTASSTSTSPEGNDQASHVLVPRTPRDTHTSASLDDPAPAFAIHSHSRH
jgi:hypothetical protein